MTDNQEIVRRLGLSVHFPISYVEQLPHGNLRVRVRPLCGTKMSKPVIISEVIDQVDCRRCLHFIHNS